MALRLASSRSVRLTVGDDGWIEVREDISRRDFNDLMASLPEDCDAEKPVTFVTAGAFTEGLFRGFVSGWSLHDENDNPVPVSVEAYQNLERSSASAIDSAIGNHFNSLTPDEETATKSKGRR